MYYWQKDSVICVPKNIHNLEKLFANHYMRQTKKPFFVGSVALLSQLIKAGALGYFREIYDNLLMFCWIKFT